MFITSPIYPTISSTYPLCPVFGECGGCLYQDISYEEELHRKENYLEILFKEEINIPDSLFEPILPSPQSYHYRNRLDLKFLRTKTGEFLMGFSPEGRNRIISVNQCPIAREEISVFLSELKYQASNRIPAKYRVANLVVRSGDDKIVRWGGIGRRSLRLKQEDYFFTEIHGERIFYSLDTFFQANLSILPNVIQKIFQLPIWKDKPIFFDLYGGVGLFAICLRKLVKTTFLIEESKASIKLAHYNKNYHNFGGLQILEGKVEEKLPALINSLPREKIISFVDPPRAGLSEIVLKTIKDEKKLEYVLYLSCHPNSLVRDLTSFLQSGWFIQKVLPFDFFPRTKHIETLVLLKHGN